MLSVEIREILTRFKRMKFSFSKMATIPHALCRILSWLFQIESSWFIRAKNCNSILIPTLRRVEIKNYFCYIDLTIDDSTLQ